VLITAEHYESLKRVARLLADVQISILNNEERNKVPAQDQQWRTLFSIRVALGNEIERLKKVEEYRIGMDGRRNEGQAADGGATGRAKDPGKVIPVTRP
jgi:hypothetical protein